MSFDGYDKGMTEDDWKVGCIGCHKTAPFYDNTQSDAPRGWFAYIVKLTNDEEIVLLACSSACRKLDWKRNVGSKKATNVEEQDTP